MGSGKWTIYGAMKAIVALFILVLASSARAQTPDGAFCLGEQIDTFAVAFPQPYIASDQLGMIAVGVHNLPDPSLGLETCFATDIVVKIVAPDGMTDVLVSGVRLAPNETRVVFGVINVANLDGSSTFLVVVDGLAEGRYTLHSEKSVTVTVRATPATGIRTLKSLRQRRRRAS